ncbi:MAG: hypothetical protein ACKVWV_13305 [Planctomycetota bacterium]
MTWWQRLLARFRGAPAIPVARDADPAALEPSPPSASKTALAALLAEMRSGLATRELHVKPLDTRTREPQIPDVTGDALRFHLVLDDAGEYLVVCGSAIAIGHLRSDAPLRFLADVEACHARLVHEAVFHAGAGWRIERHSAAHVRVNGRDVTACGLFDGDEVELARNLRFRFREPEAASRSAVLELLGGAECEGCSKVLLLARGAEGMVRIGARRNRHIPLADVEHEIALTFGAGELVLHCAGGIRGLDLVTRARMRGESVVTEISVPCPPRDALHMLVDARATGRPPIGLSLAPAAPAHGPRDP